MSSDEDSSGQDESQIETSSATDDSEQSVTCLKPKNKATGSEEQPYAADSSSSSSSSSIPCFKRCVKNQKRPKHKAKQHAKYKAKQHKKKKKQEQQIVTSDSNDTSTATDSTDEAETSETDTTAAVEEAEPAPAAALTTISGAPPADLDWTLSDDAILRGMKTDERSSVSWREIAKTLRKSQQACKNRWKAIQHLPSATPGSPTGSDAGAAPAPTPISRGAGGGGGEEKRRKQQGKGMKQKKKDRSKQQQQAPEKSSAQEGEADDEDTPDEDDRAAYAFSDLERRRQHRYFHRHILGNLYPPTTAITPDPEDDTTFPQQDCDILAACESRHEHVKWLEMQANFYNVTGRMIPLHVIRDKCERGQERKRIETWAKDVTREKQLEPES